MLFLPGYLKCSSSGVADLRSYSTGSFEFRSVRHSIPATVFHGVLHIFSIIAILIIVLNFIFESIVLLFMHIPLAQKNENKTNVFQ